MAGNKIIVFDEKGEREVKEIKGIKIKFRGEHNLIKVSAKTRFEACEFNMASNCVIEIGETTSTIKKMVSYMNSYNKISIGKNFSTLGVEFRMQENFVSFKCGNDCMFSKDIMVMVSDGHAIYDTRTKKVLNKGMCVMVGNHVWIARNVTLLKDAYINDNSVVGTQSLITKKIPEKNVVIAGVPAKVVKRHINWDKRTPEEYK